MRVRVSTAAPLTLLAVAVGLTLPPAPAGAAAGTSPLPASNYGVRAACTAAPGPRRARCMALTLVPRTAAARAHRHPLAITRATPLRAASAAEGAFGLRPGDLHAAYQLPAAAPSPQTIAIVDAYNDPTAEADLATYDREFGLPECSAANGCLTQLNQAGESANPPFPKTGQELQTAEEEEPEEAEMALGWGLETSLDLQAAHATCQSCHILLVAARSPADEDLIAAEQTAVAHGANEISNSWGGAEPGTASLAGAFDHPGVVITASAGDGGYLEWDGEDPGYADFPASSPDTVAVGGTRLQLGAGASYVGETVWNGNGAGGGGCSREFAAPQWQLALRDWAAVGCGSGRAVADVSAVADPSTGLAVYDSSPECESTYEEGGATRTNHWCTVGGTSLASPVIAAVFALAGGADGVAHPAQTLYRNLSLRPSGLHDVSEGSNGECASGYDEGTGLSSCRVADEAQQSCASELICLAGPGYDGPTGVGTPAGTAAFAPSPERPATATALPLAAAVQAAPSAPSPQPPAAAARPPEGHVLGLALTPRAALALRRGHVRASSVVCVLLLSAPARVRVTLSRLVRVRGRLRWRAVDGYTVVAHSGRNRLAAPGHGALPRGRYQLVVAPAHGQARALSFHV